MFSIHDELKKLPDKPGVYIMKNKNQEIIYIGKAVNLKNRVRQYFQSQAGMSPKTRTMVSKIEEFEYIVTHSELEALILECTLIKKHKPKFNILLKDDKSYPYIKVTMNEEYPRVLMTRRLEKDGAKYFGPYSNGGAVRETLALLKKLFPLKTCKKALPRDIGKDRPCLNYQIYQCLAPCQGDVNKEEYRALMKDICSFLNGKQEEIINRLEMSMRKAAEEMEFEKAASLRDKINGLKHIAEKQKVLSTAMEDQDVIAFAKDGTDSCAQVFFIRRGKLIGREHFIIEDSSDVEDKELIASFIKQFYSEAAFIPGEILLQQDIEELSIIEKWLHDKKGAKVYVKVPKRGDKVKLLEMVTENANIALKQFKHQVGTQGIVSKEGPKRIAEFLELPEIPRRIEAYDISNTGASEMVASMIVFENGLPAKKEYRRFKIKGLSSQNDYGSMQEVVYRRFKRAQQEGNDGATSEGKFAKLPDLILLDGGLGHLNAVQTVLDGLGICIPSAGMVKDNKHRTRGLVTSTGEIDLAKDLTALRFVTSIQDEAHRFAVEYNKKLRRKRYEGSVLDEIEGIGSKRKKTLIKHFGSINKIKSASIEDLATIDGINKSVAEKIYAHFH